MASINLSASNAVCTFTPDDTVIAPFRLAEWGDGDFLSVDDVENVVTKMTLDGTITHASKHVVNTMGLNLSASGSGTTLLEYIQTVQQNIKVVTGTLAFYFPSQNKRWILSDCALNTALQADSITADGLGVKNFKFSGKTRKV